MKWILIAQIVYVIIVILTCLRIIYDTHNNSKTLAYLLLVFIAPFIGIIFYFSIGINYSKRKMFSKKLSSDEDLMIDIRENVFKYSATVLDQNRVEIGDSKFLSNLILSDTLSPLTENNQVKILVNGEQKFPEVLAALTSAKKHIHIEYYIYEDDHIGKQIEEILIQKASEGVDVRFIYDDFGSSSLRKRMAKNLNRTGVESFAFSKVKILLLANRLNYRNHRKIIVIDGVQAFVGGINVSDKYSNNEFNTDLYWRDMHLKICGAGVHYLQYLFLCDWNFCAKQKLQSTDEFFPKTFPVLAEANKLVQIVGSGPDSDRPSIMFAILQAIQLAKSEILITTPYFIPGDSIINSLITAALSGVKVKLLVPGISDSKLVNLAGMSYYGSLLNAGVDVYLYQKGFVHAKTMVVDRSISMVGTANMDQRSFELNFEVNAVIYDEEIGTQMSQIFYTDLKSANKIDVNEWNNRTKWQNLQQQIARLFAPLL